MNSQRVDGNPRVGIPVQNGFGILLVKQMN